MLEQLGTAMNMLREFSRAAIRRGTDVFTNLLDPYEYELRMYIFRVYMIVGLTMVCSIFSIAMQKAELIATSRLSLPLSAALLGALDFNSNNTRIVNARLYGLLLFGFNCGQSLGPLLKDAIHMNTRSLTLLLSTTAIIFMLIMITAMVDVYEDYVDITETLMAIMDCLTVLCFLRADILGSDQLYLAIVIVLIILVLDTQFVLQAGMNGYADAVTHAQELFVTFLSLFLRLVLVYMKPTFAANQVATSPVLVELPE